MINYTIGIDPDSKAHGVAEYQGKTLANLYSLDLMGLRDLICELTNHGDVAVHIEDVNAVSAAFGARDKNRNGGLSVKLKMAQHIGMCKQAQIEVERMCEHLGIEVVKHKISKQWKDAKTGKPMFEKLTGWKGRSNEDTRSAAYFGWLGVQSGSK